MNYQQTIQYLFEQLPMFQRVGAAAFKKDLTNTLKLCEALDNPQHKFKSVHVAGTNGKGSTSHLIAGALQQAGYSVGLYISPHYKDFRERIKINGEYIAEQEVVDFVQTHKAIIDEVKPSFFEITVVMAFDHFARHQVDVAVVEVGMGGRFDSTNVITPELSVITNIGLDHTQFLGTTLPEIAFEKAGIIKPHVPVVIGETQAETKPVFDRIADERNAPISYADKLYSVKLLDRDLYGMNVKIDIADKEHALEFKTDLFGPYQLKNMATALAALYQLQQQGWNIKTEHITTAFASIRTLTAFIGRGQVVSEKPLTILDSGHNADGVRELLALIDSVAFDKLHFVIGTVSDKDVSSMLAQLPTDATYYFCKPDIPRGGEAEELKEKALSYQLHGETYNSVLEAYKAAQLAAKDHDLVIVGGSIFVVAEVL